MIPPKSSLSAHLGPLYPGQTLTGKLRAARRDGFSEVEFWELTPEQAEAVRASGLRVCSVNVPRGAETDCGRMGDPAAVSWWRTAFDETLATAVRAGARFVNLIAGRRLGCGADQDAILVGNLDWALARSREADVELILEPLSDTAYPGSLITTCERAAEIRDALHEPHRLGLLFDAYHVACSGLEPATVFRRHAAEVRHVQIADAPGRGEPGTGSIDWTRFFDTLRDTGYRGSVGLEYHPGDGLAGLGWTTD